MKLRLIAAIILIALSGATSVSASDYYKLERVRRVDVNLYSATNGTLRVLIETHFCYEYAIGGDAILKYEPNSYGNKIIFDDDTACDVVKVVVQ